MNPEILRRAAASMREGNESLIDEQFFGALASWLDSVADAHEPPNARTPWTGRTICDTDEVHAFRAALAYLGESA
jgi:hypothetical protein